MSVFKERVGRRLMAAYYVTIVFVLFFPVLVVAPMSFSNDSFLKFPPKEFGFRWYEAYFTDPVWIDATIISFRIAFISAAIATTLGTLAVIGLHRWRPWVRKPMTVLFIAPAIVPHVITALGIFIVILRVGFDDPEIAVIAAHSALALPFIVMIVGASLQQIDPTLERAARVLGAGPVRAFFHATLPPLMPGIVAASIFAFFVSFDELIVALFVMGGTPTLPVQIWADLRYELNPTIAAVSILLVVMATVAMTLAELLRRRAVSRQKMKD